MTHVTLIDKDRGVLNTLSALLEDEGFRVERHTDSLRALQAMRQRPTSLAVMNMKMPKMDGISMLEQLKSDKSFDFPVVFLSEDDDQADELMALRMGAEDYVQKPFSPRILMARLQNCLRRADVMRKVARESAGKRETLKRGALELEPNSLRVRWKGHEIRLTTTQFETLYFLAEKPDYVRSRPQIMDHIYGAGIFVEERVVDSHVKRIRKAIRDIDPEFSAVETVYGAGYRFLADQA